MADNPKKKKADSKRESKQPWEKAYKRVNPLTKPFRKKKQFFAIRDKSPIIGVGDLLQIRLNEISNYDISYFSTSLMLINIYLHEPICCNFLHYMFNSFRF